MALPRGWDETANEWRVRLRAPGRFTRIRPKPLEGVKGVYMVGGPLKTGDRERGLHAAGAFVPQALRFKKADWPSLTAAVGWFQASRFSGGELDNPPRRAGKLMQRGWRALILRERGAMALDQTHVMGERGPKTMEARRRLSQWLDKGYHGYVRPYRGIESDIQHLEHVAQAEGTQTMWRRANPPLSDEFVRAAVTRAISVWERADIAAVREANRQAELRARGERPTPREAGELVVLEAKADAALERVRALQEIAHGESRLANPVARRGRAGSSRLKAFRHGAEGAVEELVKTESELAGLVSQVLELSERGEKPPAWILDRARGLQLERRAQLEAVQTAVARHRAAVEEFSTPKARRANPAGARADAVRMFKQFHGGKAPTGYRFQRLPDLSQLVTLGRAVSIDYQLEPHVARGSRNTPYTHSFGSGSTLLTDPTGRALVIVGNLRVSRSPRGRFGYIRTASGG